MRRAAALLLVVVVAAGACSSPDPSAVPTRDASRSVSPSVEPSPAASSPAPRSVRPADLDVRIARATVRHLAGEIGPREATGGRFARAVGWLERRLESLGWVVRRQRFDVPAGVSWGVPVDAGRSTNLVATLPAHDPSAPHVVVGAHLDTVPQAPGAEDNASGVGVLLAVATATADRRTRLPVALVAFGAEEPRGPTDEDHHYGSRAFVRAMSPGERRALRGMVSLDRVGVGAVVRVCSAVTGGSPLRRELLRAARRSGVPAGSCVNRSSDHWSFVRAGLPGVRLGSTPYAAYHSAADLPGVVDDRQLARAGRLVLAWLASR